MKKIKDVINNYIGYVHGSADLISLWGYFYPNLSVDSMQSPIKTTEYIFIEINKLILNLYEKSEVLEQVVTE